MSNWNCELFNKFDKKMSKYSYIELAFWITKCRHFISKINYYNEEEYFNEKSYYNDVHAFCLEWEEHYKQNIKKYESEKFKKALLWIGRKDKSSFFIDFGNDKQDITDMFYNNLQYNNAEQEFLTDKVNKLIINKLNEDIFETSKNFKDCFFKKETFKSKFDEIIRKQYFYNCKTNIRFLKDEKWFKSASFDEFMNECESIENYDIKLETKDYYSSYNEALETYDIPSTTYNDYMSKFKSEISYDKKFFINLAFLLSLPFTYAEKLLHFNGYSMTNSLRVFDTLCEKTFRIGFGRDYFIVLIDKFNDGRQEESPKYIQVQNITKTMRNKN